MAPSTCLSSEFPKNLDSTVFKVYPLALGKGQLELWHPGMDLLPLCIGKCGSECFLRASFIDSSETGSDLALHKIRALVQDVTMPLLVLLTIADSGTEEAPRHPREVIEDLWHCWGMQWDKPPG